MTADEFKFIRYMNADTSRFSFWVIFKDNRKHSYGKQGRKELISFFTDAIGPLGEKWQYEKTTHTFCIKLDKEADATMILLKYHR